LVGEKRHFNVYFVKTPTERGLCGDHEDVMSVDIPRAREILKQGHYPDLHTFLNLVNPQDPWSEKTAEEYWLGNEKVIGTEQLLEEYLRNGKPMEVINRWRQVLPKEIPLSHTAQVAFVATAGEHGQQKANLITGCMVVNAKVVEQKGNGGILEMQRVVYENNKYQIVTVRSEILGTFRLGQKIALHQGQVATELTEKQSKKLAENNKKVIKLL
jgi:hypothetical protein